MAQRRQNQQRQRQQYQRSPGNYGPPAKRPRTAAPPPLPPLEWNYDYQDRNQRGRYPHQMYDEYERMADYQPHRPPRRDYVPPYHEEEYGGYGGDYRDARGGQRRPMLHEQQYRDRQQFQPRQHVQRAPGQQQRGPPQARGPPNKRGGRNRNQGGSSDNWGDGRKRRERTRKMSSPKAQGDRRDHNKDDSRQDFMHRNWTKTYWVGRGDNHSKRQDKKLDVDIPEDIRFKILCGMVKSKFKMNTSSETLDLFLRENTVGLKPSFAFKRADSLTTCKFYLNSIYISEGRALTRCDAKRIACDKATELIERETSENILSSHERVDVSKLSEEENDTVDHSMLSHLEKFTGDKPLSNFVLLQTDGWTDDGKWNSTSVLVQSAAFSRMELHFQLQGQEYKRIHCNIHIGGKFLYSGRGRLVKDAKNWASKGAIEKLQRSCYTLLIKEGTKDEEKTLPGIPLHETVGNISESVLAEQFRANTSQFISKYAEEEDMTKPLVILIASFSTEEKEIILDVAKTQGFVQRDADIRRSRREEERKDQERKDQERKEQEKREQEKAEQEKAEQEKKEQEAKESKAKDGEEEEEKDMKTEIIEEPGTSKESKPEQTMTDDKEEVKEKPAETEAKEEEQSKEEVKGEEPSKEAEVKGEEKKEEPPKLVLIRKYAGIDTLEYVLNKGGETWKYKVRPPGPTQKPEQKEGEGSKEEEGGKKEGEAAEQEAENGAEGQEEDEEAGEGEGMMDEHEELECVDQADCDEEESGSVNNMETDGDAAGGVDGEDEATA